MKTRDTIALAAMAIAVVMFTIGYLVGLHQQPTAPTPDHCLLWNSATGWTNVCSGGASG